MRGCKPKPTKLKERSGNPGKRKLAREPQFAALDVSDLPAELHHPTSLRASLHLLGFFVFITDEQISGYPKPLM